MISRKQLFSLLIFFLSIVSLKADEKENRSVKYLGLNYGIINHNNNQTNTHSLIGLNWKEYAVDKERSFFTPFYNLEFGRTLGSSEENAYYSINISPGLRVNLDSWYNKGKRDINFFDFELSTGIFFLAGTGGDANNKHIGIKTDFSYIIEYNPVKFIFGFAAYSNMPFDATMNFGLSYRF